MLNFLFAVLMIVIFGKLMIFAVKAAWGISRILVSLVFLPLALVGLVLTGLMTIAFPILLIIGIISLLTFAD